NLLLAFHTENPDQPGIKKAALIQRFGKYVDQGAFDALVREAEKAGLLQIEDGVISHPKAGAGLRKADEKAASVILGMLKDGSATPPLLPDLLRQSRLDSGVALRALSLLEKQGLIYRINKELYYEKSAFEQLKSKARAYFQENARAQASELKEALGLSRKFAIPLFEHWDSNGFTKRDGDFRVIGSRD
ncbi:MAG: SelB C-terminal domain-containing protein, partial [Coriobacteriia bacterium]|nr:SelB C-terminal domain-containing protein [Coriobacteriia bacterium]